MSTHAASRNGSESVPTNLRGLSRLFFDPLFPSPTSCARKAAQAEFAPCVAKLFVASLPLPFIANG